MIEKVEYIVSYFSKVKEINFVVQYSKAFLIDSAKKRNLNSFYINLY